MIFSARHESAGRGLKMEVKLAEHHGFCYGVKRAVKMAQDSIGPNGPSYTLGPIIHNPQMVERLAEEGVGMVSDLGEMEGGTIIIRSHGVGPATYEQAKAAGYHIVDATCPHVKKAQMAAHTLSEEGYLVVIVGEKRHPEVKSIFEWSGKQATIIETTEEAAKLKFATRLGIVAQTTFSGAEFKKIVGVLLDKSNDIKIERTICAATEQRQAAAIKLAQEVDLMIVIGGKNSANTSRLAELCLAAGCAAHHIETAGELEKAWFEGVHKVGITAGASTPDWIIEEVYRKVQDMESLLKEETIQEIHAREVVEGKIVAVRKNEVFVDLGYKEEGVIPLSELAYPTPENASDIVSEGDTIAVYVISAGGKDGVLLSKIKADKIVAWEKLEEALAGKAVLQVKVTEAVKGGLSVAVFGVRGFVPASQVDVRYVEDLSKFVGETIEVLPIEVDAKKQRAVLSRRAPLEEKRRIAQREVFSRLEEGQVMDGTVKKIVDYGAFIDIGGVDGLAHISDLSWERVKHPSEVVKEGDAVSVLVKKFDPDTKRISLSLKDVTKDPWLDKAERLKEGDYAVGKVAKIMDFGVFLTLEGGVDGLIRLPELSEKRIAKAEEVVKVGDELKVKIIQVDVKNKRIGLSLIKAEQDEEKAQYKSYMKEQTKTSDTLGDRFSHLFKDFSD